MLTLDRKLGFAALVGLSMSIGAAFTPAAAQEDETILNYCCDVPNALTATGVVAALLASGSGLGDLDGVTVETVLLPPVRKD